MGERLDPRTITEAGGSSGRLDMFSFASAVAAERMVRVELRPLGQQRNELVPERFGEP